MAVVMFAILCALIVLGRYFARHKGKTPKVQSHSIMTWSVVLFRVDCSGTEVCGQIKGRRQLICLLSIVAVPGTYFTHEAKGADDAADADTAIINAEGGHNNTDEKKEYYI